MIRMNLGKISQDAPTATQSVSQAGMVGREITQLGQTIAQTGERVGSLVERRRAEEARDIMTKVGYQNKIDDAELTSQLELRAEKDPSGITEEYNSVTQMRHEKMLKSIENDKAREILKLQLESERKIGTIKMRVFEQRRKTENYILNENIASDKLGQSMYEKPVGGDEFQLELDTRLASIDLRDMDDETKLRLKKNAINSMVKGNISGMAKGGALQDFSRARRFINDLDTRDIPIDKDKLLKQVNNEMNYKLDLKRHMERQNKIALQKQYDQEKYRIKDLFSAYSQDPTIDVEDQLKVFKLSNKFSRNSYTLNSKKNMSEQEIVNSEGLKFQTMEAIAESTNPLGMKDVVYEQVLSGTMSVEDGLEVIDSLEIQTNSQYAREEFTLAKKEIMANFNKRFLDFNGADKKEKAEMERQLYTLVREKGLSPRYAAQVITHTRNMEKKASAKINGYTGDLLDRNSLKEYGARIAIKQKNEEISPEDAKRIFEQIKDKFDYLNSKDQNIDTFNEIMRQE